MTMLLGWSDTLVECDLAFRMPDIFPAGIYRNPTDDFYNIGKGLGERMGSWLVVVLVPCRLCVVLVDTGRRKMLTL